jgi:hypothetical protein
MQSVPITIKIVSWIPVPGKFVSALRLTGGLLLTVKFLPPLQDRCDIVLVILLKRPLFNTNNSNASEKCVIHNSCQILNGHKKSLKIPKGQSNRQSDRKYHDKKKKDERTNNNLQNTTQNILKVEQNELH